MSEISRRREVFHGLGLNTGAHALLILGVWLASTRFPAVLHGGWLGWNTPSWIAAAVAVPIVHQGWVWLWWRTQYYLGLPERLFGLRSAFRIYGAGFTALAFFRIFTVIAVGAANTGTLAVSPTLSGWLCALLLAPVVWLMVSIHRYFGFAHALGGDHFFEEHRNRGICRQGIFRYVPNAMYTLGFLGLWAIAIGYRSQAALLIAAYNHASIWVHYFALERPDMREIYGARSG